jgi:hypothetical protein
METRVKPDYIGHGNAAWDGALYPNAEWGMRAIAGRHDDVDGYGSREAAERAIELAPAFNLPAQELVRRVNGQWCNVW